MISFQNISKKYKGRNVLSEINLEIQGREFVSLIGPSGAGKSTLLHILLGTVKPSAGRIQIDDFQINKMPHRDLHALRSKIGIITGSDTLLDGKTVYENIAFALEALGYPSAHIKQKTNSVIEIIGLHDHKKHFPDELSAGERKKTVIARALTLDPKLIIADEPTANLDPDAAREVMDLLLKINEHGTTIILATHHKELVDLARQRVVRIEEGRIVSDKQKSGYNHK